MIVGDLKPIEEIAASIRGYRKVQVLGCGSCVTVCRVGGDAEARDLVRRLSHPQHFDGAPPQFAVQTPDRQCDRDVLEAFLEMDPDTDAILSLACGVGVQIVADLYEHLPVLPALSTTFMGGADEPGVWREKCRGCGDCLLGSTAGICPIARCAKRLLNGPCGGSSGGACEIDPDVPCAWHLIHDRLVRQERLHLLYEVRPPRDWREAGHEGPRERRRTGIA